MFNKKSHKNQSNKKNRARCCPAVYILDTGTWRTDKDTKVHDDVWRRLHRTVHADLVFSDEGELAESVLIFFNLELGGHVLWWVRA